METNPGSEVSVFWVEPSATNNAGTVSLSFRSHAPPVRLPVGETMVQYIFEDDMDSVAFCQFSVIVVEGESSERFYQGKEGEGWGSVCE